MEALNPSQASLSPSAFSWWRKGLLFETRLLGTKLDDISVRSKLQLVGLNQGYCLGWRNCKIVWSGLEQEVCAVSYCLSHDHSDQQVRHVVSVS